MRFDSLELLRYGHFSGQALEFPRRAHDFHLVVGRNEAGKSTLRRAIHELLFGMPMNTPMTFLHAGADLALNAVLSGEHGELVMGRRRKRDGGLVDGEGEKLAPDGLSKWLGGVTEAFYERMFGLDHRRLEQGSLAMLQAGDDVDSVLFQAAAGLSTLNTVLAGLREEAASLWTPHHARNRLWYAATDRYKEAEKAVRAATVRPTAWVEAQRDSRRLDQAFEQARDRCTQLRTSLLEMERLRRLAPLLAQIREYESLLQKAEQLIHGEGAPLLSLDADIQQLETTRLRVAGHAYDIQQCESRIALLQEQLTDVLRQLGRNSSGGDAGLATLAAGLPSQPLRHEIATLLKEGQELRARREADHRSWQDKEQELEDLRARIQTLPAVEVGPTLRQALDAATAAGDLAAVLASQEHKEGQEALALEQQLSALRQPELMIADTVPAALEWLAHMQPWPAQALVEQVQRRRELQAELDSMSKRVREAGLELDKARLRADQFRRSHQAVSPDELQAARKERDSLWQAVLAGDAALASEAERYEGLVRMADMLADRQLQAVDAAASLQALEHDSERQQAALEGLETSRAEARDQLADFDEAWAAGCSLRHLPLMSPASLQGWLPGRDAALQLYARLQLTSRDLERIRTRHDELLSELLSALQAERGEPASAKPSENLSLPAAVAAALAYLQHIDATVARREALTEQLQRLQPMMPALETASLQAQVAYADWQQRRQAALQRAGLPPEPDDAYIESALLLLNDADELLKSLREQQTEHDRLDAELAHFSHAVGALAARLQRSDFQADQPALQLQGWVAQLAPLHAAARDHEQTVRQLAVLNERLLDEAQGRARAEVEAELDAQDLAGLAAESLALSQQLEEAEHERDGLAVERDQARSALAAISGGDDAAQAEARRQEALADMADTAERYVSVYAQYRLLEHITERYRERSQGPLLARAGQLFSRLTLGAHEGLMIDGDTATLWARRAGGQRVPLEGLSDGTRDQLYLALRLAALELYLDSVTALPFIADDLFVNYDDVRSLAGLQELVAVSQRTQVIFLTHHEHVAEMARTELADKVNIIEMPAV